MNGWLFAVPAAFAFMNALGFVLMGADKRRARRGKFRIPEAALFAVAFLFGGVGSTVGMYAFRHKTKQLHFMIFFPVLAVFSVAAAAVCEYFVWIALCG